MKKRILIAESGTGYGGTAKYLASLMPLLDRKTYHAEIVAAELGPFIQKLSDAGVSVRVKSWWRFPWKAAMWPKAAPALLRKMQYVLVTGAQLCLCVPLIAFWLKRNRVEVVHLNNELISHLPLVLASRMAGCRVLCHFHGWRPLFKTEHWVSRFVDQFISVTHAGANYYSEELGGREVKGIPNGLLSSEYKYAAAEAAQSLNTALGIKSGSVLIACVGRLIPLKGHSFFLKAMAKALMQCPALEAVIVGSDPEKDEPYKRTLMEQTAELGLQGRVRFIDWLEDVEKIYAAAEIVVMPSVEPESFGLVGLEAMAARKPVIATRLGGFVDVVRDGQNGILIDANDVEAFSKALAQLALDPQLRERMGERGFEIARTEFTMETNAKEVMTVYDRLALQNHG